MCDVNLLDDEKFVQMTLREAAAVCKSTLLGLNHHKFDPQGVTAVAMLAESHISIHTWPEKGMAVCDIFTCGDHTDPQAGVDFMQAAFRARAIVSNEFVRPLE